MWRAEVIWRNLGISSAFLVKGMPLVKEVFERKEMCGLLRVCSLGAGLERDRSLRNDNEMWGAELMGLRSAAARNPALRRHSRMENHAASRLYEEIQGQRQIGCCCRKENGRDCVGVAHRETELRPLQDDEEIQAHDSC